MATPRIRNDSDRTRVLANLTVTLARIRAYRRGITDLRDAITLRLNDGLKAADYTGTRGGDDGYTTVERAALLRTGDQAHDDLAALDRALVALAEADSTLVLLSSKYPLWGSGPKKGKAAKPGVDPCPPGRCGDCWAAAIDRKVSKGRFRNRCRRCGEHLAETGNPYPPEVLAAAEEYGWDSWRVARAVKSA